MALYHTLVVCVFIFLAGRAHSGARMLCVAGSSAVPFGTAGRSRLFEQYEAPGTAALWRASQAVQQCCWQELDWATAVAVLCF